MALPGMFRNLCLLALVPVAACAQGNHNPSGPGGAGGVAVVSAVPVTNFGYNNETSIAVNPTRPTNVIATWQVPASAAASEDGGKSWVTQALPGTGSYQLAGDPLVLFDGDGRAYALYIAFDRPEDYDTLGKAAHRNGIFLNRSDDGGHTWGPQATIVSQPEQPGIPFEDKPMAAVDRTSGPRRGTLYVAWTEFRRWQTVILFARSTDGGRTFSAPIEISDRPGSPKDTVGADEGTTLGVAPDGTVYVAWSDSTGVLIDRSGDGGTTWGADVRIARTPDIVFKVQGVARTNGYPALAVDPRDGRLFIEWVDRRYGGAAVLFSSSTDGGRSWSAPRVASDNGPGDPLDRFFSWMALDPRSGDLVIGYYRQEPAGALVYMLSYSLDRGATFRHQPWSAAPFPATGAFLGDYTGVDVFGGVAYAAWSAWPAPGDTTGGPPAPRQATRVVVGRATLP